MITAAMANLAKVFATEETTILAAWLGLLAGQGHESRIGRTEAEAQVRELLRSITAGLTSGNAMDSGAKEFDRVREFLADISRARAIQGFSASETARLIFSLKEAALPSIKIAFPGDTERGFEAASALNVMIDDFGLFTVETYQRSREEVIVRQHQEIAELSTPVVKLWQGILALPLIGTLDSSRTQVVMENLLQSIVDTGAEIAIIDITGVPTVDTLVAQHLLKTVAAARLMGADCLISGIRPQIAQTMVHLGVELNVVSKASLADAFALALRKLGKTIVSASALRATSSLSGASTGTTS